MDGFQAHQSRAANLPGLPVESFLEPGEGPVIFPRERFQSGDRFAANVCLVRIESQIERP